MLGLYLYRVSVCRGDHCAETPFPSSSILDHDVLTSLPNYVKSVSVFCDLWHSRLSRSSPECRSKSVTSSNSEIPSSPGNVATFNKRVDQPVRNRTQASTAVMHDRAACKTCCACFVLSHRQSCLRRWNRRATCKANAHLLRYKNPVTRTASFEELLCHHSHNSQYLIA